MGSGAQGILRPVLAAIAVALALTLAAPATPAMASRSVGLTQGKYDVTLPAGGEFSQSFEVFNDGTEGLDRVYVYVANIEYDKAGGISYPVPSKTDAAKPGGTVSSPATWVSLKLPEDTKIGFNAPYVSIPASGSIPVGITIAVPANTPPGDYGAAVFFEMGPAASSSAGSASSVSGRIGVRLRIRIEGTVKQDFRFGLAGVPRVVLTRTLPYGGYLDNRGNIDVKAGAAFALSGSKMDAGRLESLYVPAVNRVAHSSELEMPGWVVGRRDVTMSVRYYDETISREVEDSATESVLFLPWPLLAALAAFAAAAVAAAMRRSARRVTGRAADDGHRAGDDNGKGA